LTQAYQYTDNKSV